MKKAKLPSSRRREGAPRKKQLPSYSSFRLRKKIKPQTYKPLPSAWRLWRQSWRFLWDNKKSIGLFILVYGILYIIFVRGLSGGVNLGEIKDTLKEDNSTATGILTSFTLFSVLLSSSGATTSESASVYQAMLIIVGSLAFIWLLRQLSSGKVKVRIRDAFYRGMAPLVPFLLVLFVIALEFFPLSIGGFILNTVQANGLATSGGEIMAVMIVSILLAILSLYLISGSLISLYIVTLPGMEPVKAIRASHQVLQMHRWSLIRKLLLLMLFLLVAGSLIFIPILTIVPSSLAWISELVFFFCSIMAFTIFHTYLYNLYKSLL